MPAVFFGHGNPMHAIRNNSYTQAWSAMGRTLPRPRAVLAISAHWYIHETAVTAMSAPPTIHDFGGFPAELYEVEYPAPGSPELAQRVQELLHPLAVRGADDWGLDHGTWAVLRHVFPQADVPVVQLSLDLRQPAAFHYVLGQRLAELRGEGVLIVGSGNLVHNIRAYQWEGGEVPPYDWAQRFEDRARELILNDKPQPLIDYESALGEEARLAVPTPDHYLPLLYVLGARLAGETVSFPVEGFDGGSMSMLTVQLG